MKKILSYLKVPYYIVMITINEVRNERESRRRKGW